MIDQGRYDDGKARAMRKRLRQVLPKCAIQKLAPSACIAMSASSGMVSNFNDAVISFGLSFSNTCGPSSNASLHPAGPVSFDVSNIIVI